MSEERIGIFGGTFAPIHKGHIKTALAFLEQAKLDKLYIMPSYIPPHKQISEDDDPAQRLEMTEIAFKEHPLYGKKIFVSDYEIKKKGLSFTYQTLEFFSSESVRLFFLCGTDMFLSLDTWRYPEKIFTLCTLAHARRYADPDEKVILKKKQEYETVFNAKIIDISDEALDISSTELRKMIEKKLDTSEYIPDKVKKYIIEHKLYKGR
ncbi:MAG: nicotinate (nicotinamide) nucleotide adenylyltransferase [Ruminococcaceae bacterium]|nr:nicotinate (nicotinamide) nucleotide adenylyltransferase [Oscillospiraceae bacterium]